MTPALQMSSGRMQAATQCRRRTPCTNTAPEVASLTAQAWVTAAMAAVTRVVATEVAAMEEETAVVGAMEAGIYPFSRSCSANGRGGRP